MASLKQISYKISGCQGTFKYICQCCSTRHSGQDTKLRGVALKLHDFQRLFRLRSCCKINQTYSWHMNVAQIRIQKIIFHVICAVHCTVEKKKRSESFACSLKVPSLPENLYNDVRSFTTGSSSK